MNYCRSCKTRPTIGDRTLCMYCIEILRIEILTLQQEYNEFLWRRLSKYTMTTVIIDIFPAGKPYRKSKRKRIPKEHARPKRRGFSYDDVFWIEAESKVMNWENRFNTKKAP